MFLTRRRFLAHSASTVVLGVGAGRAVAQPGPPLTAPPPTFRDLRRGVGTITSMGGAIGYLVNDAGAMAVDSQYASTAPAAVAGLRQRSPTGIELLCNTHHHADHTGGNQVFRGAVRRIVAHANCVAWHKKTAAASGTEAQNSFADTTFTDRWKTGFGDETVQARYYGAGHTSGDAVYHFERANVVHMGDLLFNRAHPNIDRPAGAHLGHWVTVLEQVMKAHGADTIFIAGHGRDNAVQCTRADLQHFRDYLSACLDLARTAVKAGQPRDALVATTAIRGFEDTVPLNARLTAGFVLGQCYDELTEKR